MRGFIRRGLRLELVAAITLAGAMPAMAATLLPTQTTLSTQVRDQGGRTQATLTVTAAGEDGVPATGAVVIEDQGKPLAGAALDAEGKANLTLNLAAGDHSLRAVYQGDAAHQASKSEFARVHAQASSTPDFQISVSPAAMTLTAGQSGSAVVSLTPENASALTGPMFVTLSCSGFPDQSSCAFTPENVEILQNATLPVTSDMTISTQAASLVQAVPPGHANSNPVAWAILFPGSLVLGGLAFSSRRRWLTRLSLVALVGFVTVLGATACAPRYNYYNHGPTTNLPTPPGTYTLQVTAQSSNGIVATTHSTTFALTVK